MLCRSADTKLKRYRQGLRARRSLHTAFPLQAHTGKGSMSARSFNPDTEDEDESEHAEANEGEAPVRTDSESEEKIVRFKVSEFR